MTPGAAQSAGPGQWMVICGENGPVMTQVFLSETTPENCPKCDDCKACQQGFGTGGALPNQRTLAPVTSVQMRLVLSALSVVGNPAQFWHENRGPPLDSAPHNLSAHLGLHAATPTKGAASWT